MCEHAVERTPSVQNMSLMASGMPSSGPALPAAMRASEAFAIALARSGVSSTKALSARAFSIAATWASASSTAEKDFFFSPSRASAKVSEVSSLTASHEGFAIICGRLGWCLAVKAFRLFAQDSLLRVERQRVDHVPKAYFAGDAHLLDHFWN